MSKKYRRIKKTLALTLALVMVLGILPLGAVALGTGVLTTLDNDPATFVYGNTVALSFVGDNRSPVTGVTTNNTDVASASLVAGVWRLTLKDTGQFTLTINQAAGQGQLELTNASMGTFDVVKRPLTWSTDGIVNNRAFNNTNELVAQRQPTLRGFVGTDAAHV
ncbi:MAG: hypothetical protein LBD23_18305, partial [Oscillospiraceae bacterium]|nr:hypothetical protein [Oscillospiraceae bacterium]